MKKWFLFVLIFILVSMWLLQLYQKSGLWSGEVDIIREKEEISLNAFLSEYSSWIYNKVVLIDEKTLQWFVVLEQATWEKVFMSMKTSIKQNYYNVFETQKPLTSTLKELWLAVTGSAAVIEVKYTEKTFVEKIFSEIWPIFLFLIILFFAAKFILPKSGGLPFNMKVGKQANSKTDVKTKFDDVAGMEEVKNELLEIVDYLKSPQKYKDVGARHPKWVLLYWLPGSGKTLLARAVAWESNVPFFSASGSEFMEMLVGMGAAKVRELFGKAKAVGTAIIFIDEIDAIGKKRWIWHTWWHQEQEQTLNQILTEMDWFDRHTNIIVIAATNRQDTLDPALLRAGRFDRKIMVSPPTYEERILIFEYYFKWKKLVDDVVVDTLAKRTSGLVGADIENIVNEAALRVAKDNRKELCADDFEYALEKVLMWPEKIVRSMLEDEKKIITYHELWHAIIMHLLPNADPVEKISIVRRWHALWATWTVPKEDKYLYSKAKFLDEVTGLLWWRAAEELFFGKDEVTTGAANDFEKAMSIITGMVWTYWMDDEIWPITYIDWSSQEYSMYRSYSEKTAEKIDWQIKKYLLKCYDEAKKIITNNRDLLDTLAKVLLAKEYLNKHEFLDIIKDPTIADDMIEKFNLSKKEILKNNIKNKKDKKDKKDKNSVSKIGGNINKFKRNTSKEQLRWMLDKFLK